MLPFIKNRIDNMPYAEMLRQYSQSSGSILFRGDHRTYFEKILKQKRLSLTKKKRENISKTVRLESYKGI